MRVIAVLTALTALAVLAGAGQTRETQENSAVPVVQRYDALVRHLSSVEKRVFCKGTKAYLNAKRRATWRWQDAMFVPRTRTSYADRRTHCSPYLKWQAKLWATRADAAFREYVSLSIPKNAICHVFGNYCTQALAVSWCESRHHITAENGQYLGLFQMGDFARGAYGHSSNALGQSYSAWRYFVASGKDWSPWSCKPY